MKARKKALTEAEENFKLEGKQRFQGGHAESIGPRPSMEDSCAVIGDAFGEGTQYYGLFDGHGGKNVSHFCSRKLHVEIKTFLNQGLAMNEAITKAFEAVNTFCSFRWPTVGSTVAIAIVIDDDIYIANVGDSRVILIENGVARRCTVDHKASDPEERRLVIERGGHVINDRVNGSLILSRSLGDGIHGKSIGIEPHFETAKRVDGMKMILACDGVWDVMSDQDAADILLSCKHFPEGAKVIKDKALQLGSQDNVSCIVVDLTPRKASD